jgi:hypothetical protein
LLLQFCFPAGSATVQGRFTTVPIQDNLPELTRRETIPRPSR